MMIIMEERVLKDEVYNLTKLTFKRKVLSMRYPYSCFSLPEIASC
jgi:hypothetical protein